jgi:hypothetical protein
MTPAVDEQRISATITTIVSDATGRTLYGGRTEEVTARVFDVSPYVVVTATHDLGSSAGAMASAEGDTGGVAEDAVNILKGSPEWNDPSGYTNTLITATLQCVNTAAFDESNAEADTDDGSNLFDSSFHPDGSLAWAYQMPCTPTAGVPDAPNGAENYVPPRGSTYVIYDSNNSSDWRKGDSDSSSFAR